MYQTLIEHLESGEKNINQTLGEFGEFIYRDYCRKQNLECKIVKYLRADVIIFFEGKEFFVDVKTTQSNRGKYKGIRPQKKYNYAYDQVFISKDKIVIYPDDNSLLNKFINSSKEILIEDPEILYQKYLSTPIEEKHITNSERKRHEIKKQIINLFSNKNLKCRVLHRGQVSKDSWGKNVPNNVPGSKKTYEKFDYTVLIKFKDDGIDSETVHNIYLLKTSFLGNKIRLVEPTLDIQKKKGVKNLLDYEDFKISNPEFYYKNLDELILFIKNL